LALFGTGTLLHVLNAAFAAFTASLTSSEVEIGTCAKDFPVAGFGTSWYSAVLASFHLPPIKFLIFCVCTDTVIFIFINFFTILIILVVNVSLFILMVIFFFFIFYI